MRLLIRGSLVRVQLRAPYVSISYAALARPAQAIWENGWENSTPRTAALLAILLLAVGGLLASRYPVPAPFRPQPPAVFIGDSLTQQLDVGLVVRDAENRGVGGITIEGLRYGVENVPTLAHAPLVVMTIGTGNLRDRVLDPVESEAHLRAILAHIHGRLLWNAVPPSDRGDPERVNRIARKLCAELGPRCLFVESPAFVPSDFSDGTHMTPAGKAKWAAHMRAALRPR